ncbi:MAG TPA: PmoA family protein [Verrucomicrobiae bacterium]|nr:PmoA family protein [Verrucomicrobiae bacterium]
MKTSAIALWMLGFCAASSWSRDFQVRVDPADANYTNAIVTAEVPADFPGSGMLKEKRTEIPFQKSNESAIVFVIPKLSMGKRREFTVEKAAPRATAIADLENGQMVISVSGKKAFVYQGRETDLPRPDIKPIYKRGGYIHPVYTPGGKVITDDYPPNHLHHHGIWFPWTKTVFEGRDVDFWNMGEGKGKVDFLKFGAHWSGPVEAGFVVEHRFTDLTSGQPKAALDETWTVTAYAIPDADYFVFDLVSTQKCATAFPLELPKYYYGGLGFRGNFAWNGENNCFFLTSDGETNRVKGNETRGNWCHIGGTLDGELAGLAILSHPENFRAPQPMRLHPKEPFFCFAPSQLGDWSIEPGKPYVSRYRFMVKDGAPKKSELDAMWMAYAKPPKVTVTEK